MSELYNKGKSAKKIKSKVQILSTNEKNNTLLKVAENLIKNSNYILKSNSIDIHEARKQGLKDSLLDRLLLTEDRILSMASGLKNIAALNDPIGEIINMKQMPNGLRIGKKRVPIGIIGIIYESRPNVTIDAFGLCFKAGNAVILRGGKEAINSNIALMNVIQNSLEEMNLPKEIAQIVEDTSRESAYELMKMNEFLDVLIPRGGAALIKSVVENSTVPVIETGTGNCHIFVDKSADFEMAMQIVENAKTSRTGVCNACEKLLVHQDIAGEFLPDMLDRLKSKDVEIRGDQTVKAIYDDVVIADETDWHTEYLDLIIGVKVVKDINEAIDHINCYGTGHSEAIITENYTNSEKFLSEVDAAAVYVNASTRFTDGEEFGFGAEIGISTQKLHARGPMGLEELTSIKYVIYGSGQIR
ncbi:MAG: Gamma-glutamyl phosphate reductase [Clostridiales bacterium 38_11]|nr:MAG: Gamma-glutamyl phosphate reductase [Clostridiales bacterium 38_11]HBH13265.1 glutamate-5-semialdehyde dehydrogenase [Clostridiales bacterium]